MSADKLTEGRALIALKTADGFAVLCALYDEALEKTQIAINDEANGGDDTQRNKRARTALQNAHPRFLVEQAIAAAHKEFKAELGDSTQTRRT